MLQTILEASLRHRRVVVCIAAAMVGYGMLSAARAKLDVLPDFAPPQSVVQTEAPGFGPEQVERLVTLPIETSLGGVPGLASLRSESIQGLSVVTAVFAEDADVFRSRQLLAESLVDVAQRLPSGVKAPRLSPLTSATMDVLKIGLTSSALSAMELRRLADWTVRPRLLMVPGVARANVFGGEVAQIRISARPERLHAHGLAFADLVAAARSATASPGGGFVDTVNQRVVIEPSTLAPTAQAIGQAIVAGAGPGALRIADVADVAEAAAPKFGDASIRGEPGVLLTLSAAYGENTVEVTDRLERALEDLRVVFEREHVTLHPDLHRPADFVDASLRTLRGTLLAGSVLVFAVLLAILRNPRATFVSLVAIPLSLLGAVIVLTKTGGTLDTMSLGGLAIAIGEVVDDAIVDVENIVRRLRQNEAAGRPRTAFAVVRDASIEVRGSVIYATSAVALVFLPLLSLRGLPGKFFSPLAISYLLAVGASLVTALTVTPALTLMLFERTPPPPQAPAVQERIRAVYRRTLLALWRRPWRIALPLGAVVVAALIALPFFGGELLPTFRENHLVLQVSAAPGTSLDESRRIGDAISARLLALPGIRTLEQQIGRAEAGEDTWSPNRSEFHVELRPDGDADATTDAVRQILSETPGIESEVLSFLGDRISETISGETSEVAISVFSDDLDLLDDKAREIAALLEDVRGAVDVQIGARSREPHVALRLRPERLRSYGFAPGEVLEQVGTAFAGTTAGQVHREGQPIDVAVMLDARERTSPTQVGSLLVRSAQGALAPLRALADVSITSGRDVVLHEGARRRQTVTCNVEGRDVASFATEARARITSAVSLPAGSFFVLGGAAEARASAVRDLFAQSAIGVLGLGLLLSLAAGHWRNLALLLLNAPLALAGGALGAAAVAWASGEAAVLSLGSLVGFVTLFGISTRNAIMMISHFHHLVREEGRTWSLETALDGASDRVVPVLMTALVTALALLPVVLRSNEAGGEIDGPMAAVILGGLFTTTLLNLVVLPRLAARFGRFEPRGAADA